MLGEIIILEIISHSIIIQQNEMNDLKPIFIIPIIVLFLLLSCASLTPPTEKTISTLHWTKSTYSPQTVVIMPFDNKTQEKDIEQLVRKSFYNHFSSKKYHDFELNEVDRSLKILENTSSRPWKEIPAADLGQFFHADFIIYGQVQVFEKVFLGIYSQIALKVKIEMVETGTGEVVLSRAITKRSHDGGVPFSLFGIIPAALRSGLHMKEERTLELANRLNRELVSQIPDPPSPPVSVFFIEIQIASFLEKGRALRISDEFKLQGHTPRIETVKIGDRLWHRILIGPYYELSEAKKVRESVAQKSEFEPILIYHYPKKSDKES